MTYFPEYVRAAVVEMLAARLDLRDRKILFDSAAREAANLEAHLETAEARYQRAESAFKAALDRAAKERSVT